MAARPRRWIRVFLFAAPPIWQVVFAPFANRVGWTPLGLPFLMAWEMAGVVLTSIALGTLFLLDERSAEILGGDQ